MAIKEERIILHKKDKNGNTVYQFPYTKGDCIETPVPISSGGHGGKTAKEARTNLGIGEGQLVDAGFIAPYAGSKVPTGWIACNGAAVSRTTYAKLFSAIGTTYGAGNGSTTFNLPNLGNNIVSDVTTGDIPVAGNGMTLGFVDSNGNHGGLANLSYNGLFGPYQNLYGTPVGTAISSSSPTLEVNDGIGITYDPAKSGIVAKMTATKTTVKYMIKY